MIVGYGNSSVSIHWLRVEGRSELKPHGGIGWRKESGGGVRFAV